MQAYKDIDSYIADFPTDVRAILEKVRKIIQSAAPDATEAIKYGIPTFVYNGNLVHFAGYKNHIGFYPSPHGITHFKEELKEYKYAKGSVQFPINQNIPYELIKEITLYRVKMNSK